MRSIRLLPIAFICGYHGFAIFAPYLLLCLVAVPIARRFR